MSILLRIAVGGRLTVMRGPFVHPYDAPSVKLMTFDYVDPPLLKLR